MTAPLIPELPPLPPTYHSVNPAPHASALWNGASRSVPAFTESQMRSYGQQCYDAGIKQERERAAQIVQGVQLIQRGGFPGSADYPEPREIADLIRKD
jgi:hypothetical protein